MLAPDVVRLSKGVCFQGCANSATDPRLIQNVLSRTAREREAHARSLKD
jgi:hypothetical protein